MNKTDKQDFLLTVGATVIFLLIFNLIYLKKITNSLEINASSYRLTGMMEYTNPNDGKVLYTPVYFKGN